MKFKNTDKFNFAFDVVDVLAEKAPNKVAMVHVDREMNERRYTFADIKKYSNMTANFFKSLGIKKGDKVMLVLKRHYQFWFSILALHKLGAVVIPATNQLVKKDFIYRFNAAEVSAIVCTSDGDTANQADIALDESPTVKTRIIVGEARDGWSNFNEQIECFSDKFERTEDSAAGEDLMLMFFTSGTTGYPKIAMHSHTYPLGHFVTAKYWHNVDPDGIHFTISDTGWGKALWGKLYGQWLCEGAFFVYDFDKFVAHDILSMIKQYNITTFCAPPTMFRFFIKEDLSKYDLSSLEYATTAGEALNPEVYYQFQKATGINLMEGFGQTETTLTICNLVGTTSKIGSMGKPSPQYKVDLVDADGKSVNIGETGEIVIRTDKSKPCGLFQGYYKDKAKTTEAWHDDIYHTGDTAWRDEDGFFWYVGRTDDLIKSSGYRIGPFEIENVIMELPYVLECAITGVPDEVRGQIVKATIVLTKGTEATEELKHEIQEYVKTNTAPYKYPRIVEFVTELPKTISGKIRRVELRERHEAENNKH
ncbi:MAG: acetyl-CoA synthetase [Clostridiales bacterium GWF2_38_85]|nr:MAG: acetyl-CoA synthetase [Clostridiales bacterium GWF2_38_85]